MGKINYGRLIVGAIVAAVFYFITDGVIHTVLGQYHINAITSAGKAAQAGDPTAYIWFALYDVAKGLAALLIYAGIRPRFGPGVKTAVWAGVVTWLAAIVAPALAAVPFPFYERTYFVKLTIFSLITVVIGAVIGAAIYKEPE
jgi:hypothetical protein